MTTPTHVTMTRHEVELIIDILTADHNEPPAHRSDNARLSLRSAIERLHKSMHHNIPIHIERKYRFLLHADDVAVEVQFSLEELRNLARGTHQAVVLNAVVPSDPTDS